MTEQHYHIFIHQGGGCLVGEGAAGVNPNEICDDHYLCDCGLEFFTSSNPKTHFAMPQVIVGRMGEEQ